MEHLIQNLLLKNKLDKFTRIEDYFDYIENLSRYGNYLYNNKDKFGGNNKISNHIRINEDMYNEIKSRDLTNVFVKEKDSIIEDLSSIETVYYKKN